MSRVQEAEESTPQARLTGLLLCSLRSAAGAPWSGQHACTPLFVLLAWACSVRRCCCRLRLHLRAGVVCIVSCSAMPRAVLCLCNAVRPLPTNAWQQTCQTAGLNYSRTCSRSRCTTILQER